jgi:hypothetical protein
MTDSAEIPHATGVNGEDWDAFSDPCQLVDIHTPLIPFHNYRQIHVSEIAFVEGVESPSIKEIPKCRKKWTDVEHYWMIVALAGYIFAEFFTRKGEIRDAGGNMNLKAIGVNWWSIAIKVASAPVVLAVANTVLKVLNLS